MLRSLFISLSHANWAQRILTNWDFASKNARRFVAGDTTQEAIQAIRELNSRGITATLDFLGENTTSPEAARQAVNEVLAMFAAIDQAGVQANVSIKLSQIGLVLDPDLCRSNLRAILECARSLGTFIRIDMEDAALTERTLEMYYWSREKGFENVGIVIQSYLYRSSADVGKILGQNGKIRLCKGAYQESPQVAYPRKADVDANYDRLTDQIFAGALKAGLPRRSSDGRVPPIPALATHDEKRIHHIQATVTSLNIPKDAFEFQMLFGIRRDLQEELVKSGYLVRVYVPYGTHWYPYFMRRLAERPANIWFIVSNFFRR